jgi:hypothetical protein
MHRESHAILFYRLSIEVWEYRSQQPKINFSGCRDGMIPALQLSFAVCDQRPCFPVRWLITLYIMSDLGRWGGGRRWTQRPSGCCRTMEIGYGHTRRSGRGGTEDPPYCRQGTNRSKSCGNRRALPNWGGAGGIGAASSLRTSLPLAPAQGLLQHQFAATRLSDDGVRVNFEAVSGVKQTFAIRGHVVDLMHDAEENDEGSK